ncbi:MAG TPA: hypothetical protein DDZ91_01170 [Firmicutes bacterium]|jgi:hypothetical protein|nr:hypothetical protein [Bacillota bacterium]
MNKADRWLTFFLIVISLALWVWKTWGFHSSTLQVQAICDGRIIFSTDLGEGDSHLYQLPLPGGDANLEVKDGAVRLLAVDDDFCPEKICIRTGWIKNQGESIICAPNKLVIQIIGTLGESVDAISR